MARSAGLLLVTMRQPVSASLDLCKSSKQGLLHAHGSAPGMMFRVCLVRRPHEGSALEESEEAALLLHDAHHTATGIIQLPIDIATWAHRRRHGQLCL